MYRKRLSCRLRAPEIRLPRMAGSLYVMLKSEMFRPNCHWNCTRLPRPSTFGSSSPMNPPSPVPCPTDAPKLMFPVRRSSTRNTTSTST